MSARDTTLTRRQMNGLCLLTPFAGLLPAAADAAQKTHDAVGLAADIAARRTTATAATDAALGRVAALNPTVGAVVSVIADQARAKAAKVRPGQTALAGVPTLVKDLIDVRGAPTRRGSRATSAEPATTQSPFVDAMEAAGLVIVGKSQTPEYGASPTTEPLLGPVTRNPANVGYSVGGSSGGAAAAVASGMVVIAQGSDGGGSLRMPAACCGVFALKPSRGRMIDIGGPKPKLELSVPGAVSRTVRDNAAFVSLLERREAGAPLPAIGMVSGPSQRRLRIGINLKTLNGDDPDPQIARAVETVALRCRALGHQVRPFAWTFDQPRLSQSLGTSMIFGISEIAAQLMKQKGVALADTGLEPIHVKMAEAGRALSPATVERAFATFDEVQAKYPAAFIDHDLILTPTVAQLTSVLGQIDDPARSTTDILDGYAAFSPYTTIQNIAGAPAMSLPLGISTGGLPIGVHVAGPIGSERMLLELAYELEANMTWRPGLTDGVLDVAKTPQQLVLAFREALGTGRDPLHFTRFMANLWGTEVLITHTPVMKNDGPLEGRKLAQGEIGVFTAMVNAIPDYRQENFTVRARGDVIEFYEEIVGTLPSGRVLRVPITYHFTIADGRIVKAHGIFDPIAVKPFSDVVKAAGQRIPD